ncbi:MAG: hypothetical protein HY903_14850 [Deltaproteobacteria bacterium]|nr:hypothetical protein [Deltaproteobacteria bacterium]
MRHLLIGLFALAAAGGCGKSLQLNLVVNDPCNQRVLGDTTLGISHIELSIAAPDLVAPEGTTWSRAEGQGEAPGITPVANATVTVEGRAANGAGAPADVLAAIGVGYVDLTGKDTDVVDLQVVFGRIDRFMNTTDAAAASDGTVRCTALSAERRGHTASLLPDGRVFIAGGEAVKPSATTFWETTEYFEPTTGLFERGPNMKWVRKAHTATVLNDGRVLLTGGVGLNGTSVDTWKVALIYNPTTGAFDNPIPMKAQRANHTATLLDDGRVLVAGGTQGTHDLDTTEIFDPTSGAFCDGPQLKPPSGAAQPRAFHSAVRVGRSQVALIGGQGAGQLLSSVHFVEVVGCGGSVAAGQSLSKARSNAVAALIPGKDAVVVAGGFDAVVTAIENGKGIDSVEVIKLSPQNLGQSTVDCSTLRLLSARGAAAAAEVPGGLLVAGGLGATGLGQNTAETIRYGDIGTCELAFTATAGGLGVPRAGSQATLMVGGDVLLSGGFNTDGGSTVTQPQAQGEIYVRRR